MPADDSLEKDRKARHWRKGISINCLKNQPCPCQPPVIFHDWGVGMDARAFFKIPESKS